MNKNLLKKLPEQISEIVKSKKLDDPKYFIIMAPDEACFGRISGVKKSWAHRNILFHHDKFQAIHLCIFRFCPSMGEITSLILPYGNTQKMNIFLEHVSKELGKYNIIMLLEQAGWYRANYLRITENLRLFKQLSHSEELNPVENVWDDTREKYFHNKAFHSLDEVEDTLCLGLNTLRNNRDYVKFLTNFPYLNITL